MNLENVVIFGGAGFIARHFSHLLLESQEYRVSHIFLVDLLTPSPLLVDSFARLSDKSAHTRIHFIHADIRNFSALEALPAKVDLIANFAAVHREPGHQPFEYFETNLLGAEFISRYAELSNCKSIIFSSSISPYGDIKDSVDESSLPIPVTPYGSSKLCAEYIHKIWLEKNVENKLTIVRPGVVFGPGENGNVTRMIKAINRGYFFYASNRDLRKAGVYVKELCSAMLWVHFENRDSNRLKLFNMTFEKCPTIEEYVENIKSVLEKRSWVPNLPFSFLYGASSVISTCSRMLGIDQPIHPERVMKLRKSNFVNPGYLLAQGYTFKYSLKNAMEDWKKSQPEDWC